MSDALTTPKGLVLRLTKTAENGTREYESEEGIFWLLVDGENVGWHFVVEAGHGGVQPSKCSLEEALAWIDGRRDAIIAALRAPRAADEPPVIVQPTRAHIELAELMVSTFNGEATLRGVQVPRYEGRDRRSAVEELARVIAEAEARGEHRGRSVLL